MAMQPPSDAPMMSAPKEPQQQEGGGDGGKEEALQQMIVQTDMSLTKLAQVLGQLNPKVGEAVMQVSQQFQKIIKSVLGEGGEQEGKAPAPGQQSSPEAGAREVQPAY